MRPRAPKVPTDLDITCLQHTKMCQHRNDLNIPLWDVPSVADFIRKHELEPFGPLMKVNKSHMTSILKAAGLTNSKGDSTVSNNLNRLRTKYRREVLDSYSVLQSYLHGVPNDNPDAMSFCK